MLELRVLVGMERSGMLRGRIIDLRQGVSPPPARPPFFILRSGARLLGFIHLGDFGDLECLRLVSGGSLGRLGAFCGLSGRSWGAFGEVLERS